MGKVLKPEIVAEDASDFWLYVDVDRGGPGNRNGEQRKRLRGTMASNAPRNLAT